ncbi:hypothetical protein KAU33_03640 [Candidatus Dependentiae bacterium]|nr:hypothetical protein [Candidatus Dependentiae bacterium]
MKSKLLLSIFLVSLLTGAVFGAAFNGSTGLVNIPTADVLEHLGYDLGVCNSMAFASEEEYLDPRMSNEQDARFNLGLHIPTRALMVMNLEIGVTQYTLLSEEGRKDGVVNFKLQLFRDPTDKTLHHGHVNQAAPMWMPSIALGVKNIVGDGLKYITPAGPYAEYPQNNSAYLVMTKKLNLSPSFGLKMHYGFGGNSFQGHGKDASPGAFFGFSSLFLLGQTGNPLEVMLDYDGNAYAFGLSFILNNPQMYGKMSNSGVRRFLPGLKVQVGISDFEEAMRDYEDAKYDGKKFSPKIEFSLGITNDYTIKSMSDGTPPPPRPPKPPKPSNKEKEEAEQARAYAEALKARKLAELARTKAKLASMRVQGINVDELKADIKPIFPLVKFSGNGFEITMIGVVFKPNSSDLADVSNRKLDKLTPILRKYQSKGVKATIIVSSANVGLALKRAGVLEQYLIQNAGFAPTKIKKKPKTGRDRIILVIYK